MTSYKKRYQKAIFTFRNKENTKNIDYICRISYSHNVWERGLKLQVKWKENEAYVIGHIEDGEYKLYARWYNELWSHESDEATRLIKLVEKTA